MKSHPNRTAADYSPTSGLGRGWIAKARRQKRANPYAPRKGMNRPPGWKPAATLAALFVLAATALGGAGQFEASSNRIGKTPTLARPATEGQPYQASTSKLLSALAQLESGGNSQAKGRAGEVGEMQCLPSVWRAATSLPLSAATNPITARAVAIAIIESRTGKRLDQLTPRQVAIAWHSPAKLNCNKLTREQSQYVQRYQNLCTR